MAKTGNKALIQTLLLRGELDEVYRLYQVLIPKKKLDYLLLYQLVELLSSAGIEPLTGNLLSPYLSKMTIPERTVLNSYLAVDNWVRQDWKGLNQLISSSIGKAKHEIGGKSLRNSQTHMVLCARLFAFYLNNPAGYSNKYLPDLYAIGDSHSLIISGRSFSWCGKNVQARALPIRGLKMHHLGHGKMGKYRAYFKARIQQVPENSAIILCMGEIDSRPNEGIFALAHKDKSLSLQKILTSTVDGFIDHVRSALQESGKIFRSVTLLGVPWPVYDLPSRLPKRAGEADFYAFITELNKYMYQVAIQAGWYFLDVKEATMADSTDSNSPMRLDDIHLSPSFYDTCEQWLKGVEVNSRVSSGIDNRESAKNVDGQVAGDEASTVAENEGQSYSDSLATAAMVSASTDAENLPTMKTFLHVGCGQNRKNQTTAAFASDNWAELRLDIDENAKPDIVGTMVNMPAVSDGCVDGIFSSHSIEHLYPYEVPMALIEFHRVLTPEGFVVIICSDLKSVCALIAEDKLLDVAYTSPAGPMAPLDILYGSRPFLQAGNYYMAKRCGFTEKVLRATLESCGFTSVAMMTRGRPPYFDLWALGSKQALPEAELRELAMAHFPIKRD